MIDITAKLDYTKIPIQLSGTGTNTLTSWYTQEIKPNSKAKLALVEQNPALAERVFFVFRDTELGQMYVNKWSQDAVKQHAAYFIARELGKQIPREQPAGRVEKDTYLAHFSGGAPTMKRCNLHPERHIIRKEIPNEEIGIENLAWEQR